MKNIKLISLLTFFSVTINAQNVEEYEVPQVLNSQLEIDDDFTEDAIDLNEFVSFELLANNDILALTSKIEIDDDLKRGLFDILILKHESLLNPFINQPEKDFIYQETEEKIFNCLNETQKNILIPDTNLVLRLSRN